MNGKRVRQQVGVALFPFLAVLICTMGALIVLLVLLVQQARVDASTLSAAQIVTADGRRALRERLEDAQWRREQLEKSRQEKTEELSQSRARLAHLEEHSQRLQAQAKELLDRARAIDEGRKLHNDEFAAARIEIERLQSEIARKKKDLEAAQKKNGAKEQSFALIPYEGANGTRRRPIYVECTDLGVVIHPEGIVLRAEDFNGPMGPGNPLDVALRAVREHIERTAGPNAGQPYPLLVVRPSGVLAFGAARSAIKSWDDEWGYELISDEKQLDFGQPDPALDAKLSKAVAMARQRQAAMIAMTPRRFQEEEPIKSFSEPASNPPRTYSAGGGSAIGSGNGSVTGTGSSIAGGTTLSAGGTQAAPWQSGGSAFTGQSSPAGSGGVPGSSVQGSTTGGTNSAGYGSSAGTQPGSSSSGQQVNSFSGDGKSTYGASSPTSKNGNVASGGSTSAGSTMGGSSSPSAGGSSVPNISLGGTKTPSATSSTSSSSTSQAKSGSTSKSKTGKNWALPDAKPHETGVTRPIRISVQPNQIVMIPERGDNRPPQVVAVSPQMTPDDVNRFVGTIQGEVKGWGLAVANGYWKPVLQAEVTPGGESHMANLQTALQGSGIELIRR
jgi:hypothetical protein